MEDKFERFMESPMAIWGFMVVLHTSAFVLFSSCTLITWLFYCTFVWPMVAYGAAHDAPYVLWRELLNKLRSKLKGN